MSGSAFGLRPEALAAWFALHRVLLDLEDQGRQPVCRTDPDSWTSDARPDVRRKAAEACGHCLARVACLSYAVAQRETAGVFGGRDFTVNRSTRERGTRHARH